VHDERVEVIGQVSGGGGAAGLFELADDESFICFEAR
jgi:hypothetical protein